MHRLMFVLLLVGCADAEGELDTAATAQATATGDYYDCTRTSVNPEPGGPVVQCLFSACHGNDGPPPTYDCNSVQKATNCGWYNPGVAQDTNNDGTPDRCCWQDVDSPGGACEVTVKFPATTTTTQPAPAPTAHL